MIVMRIGRPRVCLALAALLLAALDVSNSWGEQLVVYRVENGAVPGPLTQEPGNPARGRQTVRDMTHVTCLICHAMPIPEEPDHGGIGPSLAGVGARRSVGELRLRLIDPKAFSDRSIMPAYYRIDGLNRVGAEFRDRPIYTAQQIEDVVAYLSSLKDE